MKTIKGYSQKLFSRIFGIITKEQKPFYARSDFIFITDTVGISCLGYMAYIATCLNDSMFLPYGFCISHTDILSLNTGDIVCIEKNELTVVWESGSHQNSLMLTEACNCKCLMCPQPPQKHDPTLVIEAEAILNLLKNTQLSSLCITGGEPTLILAEFKRILKRIVTEHPHAIVNILTNGKLFQDLSIAQQIAKIATSNVVFCVSLHSDVDVIHDVIVGVTGSHEATELGIYNLARCGLKVEIRHVVTRKNFSRLPQFSEYLYSYFPFCSHYAIMACEACGYCAINFNDIHIYPYEYIDKLSTAVVNLYRRGLPVSVYNIPLCLCSQKIHEFAKQSISTWKNIYLPKCDECMHKKMCAGFFSTSCSLPEEHIKPIKEKT